MRILAGALLAVLGVTAANAADLMIHSPAFKENAMLDRAYTCDGKNLSPPLNWANPPPNTQAYALVIYSPDWPGQMIYKWIVINIPKEITSLEQGQSESLPSGAIAAKNSFDDDVYRGPCAPDNKLYHYVVVIYALDRKLEVDDTADPETVMATIKQHAIKEAKTSFLYKH